ncbi:MAG: hypothetical protein AAGL34_09240 [Bacteroidota bacterium]
MKTKSTLTITLFLLVIVHFSMISQSNDFDIVFGEKGYDGARCMIKTIHGNYVLAGWYDMEGVHDKGKGIVVSFDATGKLNWKKILTTNGKNQISALANGANGRILALIEEFYTDEEPGDVTLVELSETGKVLNKHKIGDAGCDVVDKISLTQDGGYILAGESSQQNDNNSDAWIAKLSSAFEIEWEWKQGTQGRDRLNDFIILANGNVLAAGNTTRSGSDGKFKEAVPWVIKLDKDGQEVWSKKYVMTESASIRGLSKTKDGGFMFVGYSRHMSGTEFNSWLGKITKEGTIVWQKSLSLKGGDYLHKTIPQSDDTFLAVGSWSESKTNAHALMVTFAEDGTQINPYSYPKAGKQEIRAVIKDTNGIALAGASDMGDSNGRNLWFLKIPEIHEEWRVSKSIDRSYGRSGKDGLRNMLMLDDGGYLLAGWIDQTTKNHVGKGYLLNVGPAGNQRWEKVITTNGNNRITNLFDNENGFLIVMEEFPVENDLGQVVLMQLDKEGNIISEKEFGGEGMDVIEIMCPAPDGGHFFVGESSISGTDRQAWIGKLSPSLNLLWQKHIGGKGNDRFTDCTVLQDGSLVAVGYQEKPKDSGGFYDAPLLIRMDGEGNLLWSKEPNFKEAGAIRGISKGKEDKLALAGYTRNLDGKEFDAWVGMISTSGEMIWNKTVPSPGFDSLMAVETMEDGSFIAIGSGKNKTTNNDAMVVHFADSGDQIETYFVQKPGKQFGRVAYPIGSNRLAIGGFDMNDEVSGDQLWLHVTDLDTLKKGSDSK